MTDISKYRNVSLTHDTYSTLVRLSKTLLPDGTSEWCNSSMEEVRKNLEKTEYNKEKIHFIKG